jgi:biotin transport system substrate-specific component
MRAATPTLMDHLLGEKNRFLRDILLAIGATGLLTLSAKIQVPLFVPMTLQSLVVLMIGAAFGWLLGAATILLYLAEGAMGLPVFAGTPEKGLGLAYMMGPTGGYLIGFVLAAMLAGWLAERGLTRSIFGAFGVMALGHGVIFLFGFAWLAALLSVEKAYLVGVVPFFAATVIKTALGAALLPAGWALVQRLRR